MANGSIWDVLRMIGRGSVVVTFQGRLFVMHGNPWWPWPGEDFPTLTPLDDRGLPADDYEFWIMPMDAMPGLRPGAIYRPSEGGTPALRAGHLSEVQLYGRWSC